MRLEPFTDEIEEPISLTDAKLFLRIDTADEDALVGELISASREHIERTTGVLLASRTLVGVVDCWGDVVSGGGLVSPGGVPLHPGDPAPAPTAGTIPFPVRPVTEVEKVELVALDGTESVWDEANYYLDTSGQSPRLAKRDGAVFGFALQALGGVRVTFTAGYDENPPADLLLAMRTLIGHWYENRGVSVETRVTEVPLTVDRILKRHRTLRL